jgi:hypothetical protein
MPAVIEGLQKMDDALRLKMTNIMHAAYYVAKQEVPFTHFSSLNGLINRTGGSLPGCYQSDKACARYATALITNVSNPSWHNIYLLNKECHPM